MTTIQDRIIEIIKKHNNEVMSFPTPRELLNANKRLEQFLLTSIKEVEEETRKETLKVINKRLDDLGDLCDHIPVWKSAINDCVNSEGTKKLLSITNKEKEK